MALEFVHGIVPFTRSFSIGISVFGILTTKHRNIARAFRSLACVVLSITMLANLYIPEAYAQSNRLPPTDAMQAAELLGISATVTKALALQNQVLSGNADMATRRQLLYTKLDILRKILPGYLAVRKVTAGIEEDLTYSFDAFDKEIGRRAKLVTLANVANFTQFGILTIVASSCRLKEFFNASSVIGITSASLTLGFTALALKFGLTGRTKDKIHPTMLADFMDLKVPSQYQMPPVIKKYVNSKPPGESRTRKELQLERWKVHHNLDANNKKLIAHLAAFPQPKRGETKTFLRRRLSLLYSLNALVEQFDRELLSLIKLLDPSNPHHTKDANNIVIVGLNPQAMQAARLLDIVPEVQELMQLKQTDGFDERRLELETLVLEKVLTGCLDVRDSVDKLDHQIHYQLDVVQDKLLSRGDTGVLLANTVNFTQVGVLKLLANCYFLRHNPKPATELITVLAANSILFSVIGLQAAKGGRRKIDSYTNMLGEFLDIPVAPEDEISPLLWAYLNSPVPGKKSTKKEELLAHWKEQHIYVQSTEIKNAKLACADSVRNKRHDTLKTTKTRLRMLFDLRAAIETFDSGLLELLKVVTT